MAHGMHPRSTNTWEAILKMRALLIMTSPVRERLVSQWVRSINLDFVDFVDFSVKRAFDYCGFRHGFLGFRKPRNPCNPHRRKISWFSWFSNLWFVYARDHAW